MADASIYEFADLDHVLSEFEDLRIQGGTDAPAGRELAAYIRSVGAEAVLRESGYIDRDFSRAFEAFYGGFYRPPTKFCTRYHFFLSPKSVPELEENPGGAGYLGFVVLWPTEPGVIGRSALVPPDGFEVVTVPTLVHIGGVTLRFESAPFATKDFGVAACATIATWVAVETSAPYLGLRTISTAELTSLAAGSSNGLGRVFPQRFGLDATEICRALHALGYEPFVYDMTSFAWDWIGTIYGHLISRIPVILMVDILRDGEADAARHAVVAVGMEFNEKQARLGKSWPHGMQALLVHDDRYGPYRRAQINRNTDGTSAPIISLQLEGLHDGEHTAGDEVNLTIKQLIVPLPAKTYTISTDAHLSGQGLFRRLLPASSKYVVRTRLVDSTILKAESLDWHRQEGVAAHLRYQSFPARVWLSEAFALRSMGGRSFARVVMDATVHRDATRSRFLWAHVGNQLMEL